MKHSFKLKKTNLKTVFSNKLGFKSLVIENKSDVQNSINTLLTYMELESFLDPVNCSYSFLNTQATFELELNKSKEKKDFFKSIKTFEDFIEA